MGDKYGIACVQREINAVHYIHTGGYGDLYRCVENVRITGRCKRVCEYVCAIIGFGRTE